MNHAWGSNELRPLSRTGHGASIFGSAHMGATIVDALDTLYIMEMKEEFERARKWVALSLNFHQVRQCIQFCPFSSRSHYKEAVGVEQLNGQDARILTVVQYLS